MKNKLKFFVYNQKNTMQTEMKKFLELKNYKQSNIKTKFIN